MQMRWRVLDDIENAWRRGGLRYLVTGGTGFIGSHLARRLTDEGEEVSVVDTNPEFRIGDGLERVRVYKGDVSDATQLIGIAKKEQVDQIVHLAYLLIPESRESPVRAVRVNCEGTNNVFEATRLLDLRRVVWASSIVVYGSAEEYGGRVVDEGDRLNPSTIYGACKEFNERMALHYHQTYGLDSIGLRFTVVYGPGRARGASAFASDLIERPALGLKAVVPYSDSLVDWMYVGDAVEAILLSSKVKSTESKVFNTAGETHTIREAAGFVRELVPDAEIDLQPGDLGWQMRINIDRARRELGYSPRFGLKAGMREHMKFIRARRGLPPM